eukprot:TRINITY_DN69666_c0_g1_i1.p1 TRINITY_DN69666_c0_g1~~TRINITY_DN69666_c0_g1_i1.p1  ORF type:complete len:264 (+),score=60.72 TRINITY_DN69666_c0_g1_i1:69-794(+)
MVGTFGVLAVVIGVSFPRCSQAYAMGALKLDNYTLDKFINLPGYSILVQFDTGYAWGEKVDEFKKLSKAASPVPRFLVAEVPVMEYGDKENDDLRERFKLTKADFPAFFLFDEAHKAGLRYEGRVDAADISGWLRRNKVLMPGVGTISEFDDLAERFVNGGLGDATLATAKELAETTFKTDANAAAYVKIMEKMQEKGVDYPETEIKRITQVLAGNVGTTKKEELNGKLRILHVFKNARKG